MEAVGAILLLFVFRVVSDPQSRLDLPVLGDLQRWFPSATRSTILVYFCGLVAVFFVVRSLVFLLQIHFQYKTAYDTAANISQELIDSYLNGDYALFLETNSAELIRTAWDAVNVVATFGFVPLFVASSEIIIIVALLAVLAIIAPTLTALSFLVTGAALALAFRVIQPRLKHLGQSHERLANSLFRLMQQSLEGARDVRLHQSEAYFTHQLGDQRRRMGRGLASQATLTNFPRVLVETVFAIFILLFVAIAALTDNLDAGTVALLGLFAYVSLRIMPSINRVSLAANNLRYGAAAIDTVSKDLARTQSLPHGERRAHQPPLPLHKHVLVEDVSYRYPGHANYALRDISLTVRRGDSVGLVGPTGAGKSTLVDLIVGLLAPTQGRILVDDVDIAGHESRWQRSLGVVSQAVFLLDDTLRRNIAFGFHDEEIDELRVQEAVSTAQLGDFIASLGEGLDTTVGERGVRLSGGQRQRLAIARALYRQPEVVVFDEGTSALDTLTETEVMAALDRLRGDRTLLMVAHRLSTVRRCDQIVLIEEGRVADVGTYGDLINRSDNFRRMAL